MGCKILPLIILLVLLSYTASSAAPVDLDKDGIADNEDKYPFDYDNDGMPDEWEKSHGLRYDINDARLDRNNDGISNLEEYKNSFMEKPGLKIQLSRETILWSLLIVGVLFIAIGIIGTIRRRKREQSKILRPQQPPAQYPRTTSRKGIFRR